MYLFCLIATERLEEKFEDETTQTIRILNIFIIKRLVNLGNLAFFTVTRFFFVCTRATSFFDTLLTCFSSQLFRCLQANFDILIYYM